MGQTIIGTSDAYTQLICNHSSELIGDYPNITFRIHYNFQVRITTSGSWYWNGFSLWFHTTPHKVNLSMSGGTTGVLASGYIDLGIGGLSTTHVPGFGCSGPFSASGTISETQTIATGSMAANLVSYGHNSAVINIALSSPRNYWYARIFNATDGTWAISSASNGHNTLSGLTPGKNYTFHVEMWRRDGSSYSSQVKVSFMTTGFSYLDGNVTNTIGNAITFPVRTYNDSFSTNIEVYFSPMIKLQEVLVQSSGGVYNYSYTPSQAQLEMMYQRIPNTLSATGYIILTTYVNGSSIGSKNYGITFNINQNTSTPVITSFNYIDTVQSAIEKTGNSKWVLQSVSKLQIKDIVANARNGASITNYRVSIGNNTVNSTSTTILVNNVVEANTGIYLTVIDSRGLQTTSYIDFTRFISYTKLYFTDIGLTRVNDVEEQTTLSMKGWFDRLTIDNVDKNTALTFKYRYRASDSSTWSEYTTKAVTISGNQFSYSNVIGNFDSGTSYVFELVISDYFNTVSNESLLMKGTFELFIGDGFVEINGVLDLTNAKIRMNNNEFEAKRLLYDK